MSLGISRVFQAHFLRSCILMEERNKSFNLFVACEGFLFLGNSIYQIEGIVGIYSTQAAIFFHLLDETQVHLENILLHFSHEKIVNE